MQQYLFKPTDRNMLREYPELGQHKEFKDLPNNEMIFVWHYVFDNGELDNLEEKVKKELAAKKAFPDNKLKIGQFTNDPLEPHIRSAIEKMRTFNMSARMRAKAIIDKNFSDFEIISRKNITTLDDIDELKKYMDMKINICKTLPDLINQVERGFGVTEEEQAENKERHESYMDSVHSHMNNRTDK